MASTSEPFHVKNLLSAIASALRDEFDQFWADSSREFLKLRDKVTDVVSTSSSTLVFAAYAENMFSMVCILYWVYLWASLMIRPRKATFDNLDLFDYRGTHYVMQILTNLGVALYPEEITTVLPFAATGQVMHRAFLHAALSALAALLAFITYVVRIIYLQRVFNRMQAAAAERASASSSGRTIKKIAIFHISIGSGHKRAAQALEAVLKEKDPTIEVQVMDMLDFSSDRNRESLYSLIAKKGYMNFIQYKLGATLYGYFFETSNKGPASNRRGIVERFTAQVQRAFFLQFYEWLFTFQPDFVISTHFLAPDLIAQLQRDSVYNVPHITVVTDYDSHRIWANLPCTQFFAPREEAALMLQHAGVPEHLLQLSGIPIVPDFAEVPSKSKCREALGLDQKLPMVLQMSGGRDVYDIFKQLMHLETPAQIVVITGRQSDVRSELAKIPVPDRHTVKLVGFTKEMHNYLTAADVIVSKPGGLTTAESLATGTPMVIVNPIPGQETRNTDMLLEAGVAIKINDLPLLPYQVDKVLGDSARLERMQQRALELGDPHAAHKVVDWVLDFDFDAEEPLPTAAPAGNRATGARSTNPSPRRTRKAARAGADADGGTVAAAGRNHTSDAEESDSDGDEAAAAEAAKAKAKAKAKKKEAAALRRRSARKKQPTRTQPVRRSARNVRRTVNQPSARR